MYNNIFENMRFNGPLFAFAEAGAFINGTVQGPYSAPGFYSVPISIAQFAPYGATPSARQMDVNLRAAYDEQANIGLQRQLGDNWLLDVTYVGTFGHRLLGLVDVSTFDGRTIGGAYSSSRINPGLGSDNARANWFNSNYNSLQTSIAKRFAHGVQFNANYTYSHALDSQSDVFNGRFGTAGSSTRKISTTAIWSMATPISTWPTALSPTGFGTCPCSRGTSGWVGGPMMPPSVSEAICGFLPYVNERLKAAGSAKQYKNLFGITLGTGFGAGIARGGELFIGDNAAAAEIWVLRGKLHNRCFVEEDVSIRAVQRVYAEHSKVKHAEPPTPKDIYEFASGSARATSRRRSRPSARLAKRSATPWPTP